MTLESIKNLVAGNQRVEIYKNEFIHSENLIFKGLLIDSKIIYLESLKNIKNALFSNLLERGKVLLLF